MIEIAAVMIVTFLVTIVSRKYIINMISSEKNMVPNYEKQLIPVSGGIIFIPGFFAGAVLSIILIPDSFINVLVFVIVSTALLFLGLVDDQIGDKDAKGFVGHFTSLFRGNLTTGGFKAILTVMAALFASIIISPNFRHVIVNTLLLSFFTNLINLMDLRPGRAAKSFLFLAVLLTYFASDTIAQNTFILIAISTVLGYITLDLGSKVMMGDCGSNTLGIILGLVTINLFNFYEKLLILGVLVAIHIIAERWSITKIIEGNRVFSYIDRFGRK
jgi:UDP-GlcNAc:undecaprenyl-phosphate/decaprenyl-phosphate GlcNAc-1-phosphate transferase